MRAVGAANDRRQFARERVTQPANRNLAENRKRGTTHVADTQLRRKQGEGTHKDMVPPPRAAHPDPGPLFVHPAL